MGGYRSTLCMQHLRMSCDVPRDALPTTPVVNQHVALAIPVRPAQPSHAHLGQGGPRRVDTSWSVSDDGRAHRCLDTWATMRRAHRWCDPIHPTSFRVFI